MKPAKDLFSKQSADYAKFRPVYPDALYKFLYGLVPEKRLAWDCGTGNGQVAVRLAEVFDRVIATDLSAAQLSRAPEMENISWKQARAEASPLEDQSTDLITVAQALHWFDIPAFWQEVNRVGRPGSVVAVFGYGLCRFSSPGESRVLREFYGSTLKGYWDPERAMIDDAYQSLDFPFQEMEAPEFSIRMPFRRAQFSGFLSSWSAVQKYIGDRGESPVSGFEEAMSQTWPEGEIREVIFPVFMRVGRI